MANRDDYRGYGGDRGRDRWWRDEGGRSGGEREGRSFGDGGMRGGRGEGESEPWRRDRYGSRYDQDRTGYGSGYDSQSGGYGRGQQGGYPQAYGVEGGREHRQSNRDQYAGDTRSRWRDQGGSYGDLELDPRDPGVRKFGPPADYAYHPQAGHEFDPDYTRWRDQQLESHDRDYRDWRAHQHKQYDDEYRKFRTDRRETFGRSFHEWRAQRNVTPGSVDTHIEPGKTGDTGVKTGHAGGIGADNDLPSGKLEPRGAMTPSPTLSRGGGGQQGGSGSIAGQTPSPGSDQGSGSFVQTSPQVQAAADGDTRRHDEDRTPNGGGEGRH